MSLDNIINKIQQDAQAEIDKINQETAKKIAKLEQEYEAKIDKLKAKMLDKVEKQARIKVEQEVFKVSSQAKSKILQKKRELLDKAFKLAAEALSKLDSEKQKKILQTLLDALPNEEGAEIIVAESSLDLVKSLAPKIRVSNNTIPALGGFIYKSPKIEIDNTYESLVKVVREDIETKVASILFNN